MMQFSIVQCNINHSWGAHNLLQHHMQEYDCLFALVSEPVCVSTDAWCASIDRRSAVHWIATKLKHQCVLFSSRQRHVIVRYGDMYIISCYISPNCTIAEYVSFLADMEADMRRCTSQKVLLCGDFNAKSCYWGSGITDRKGELVERWAAACGLILLNEGTLPTCIRHHGESIIDLSWATPSAYQMVTQWTVDQEVLTLSDHRYIYIQIGHGLTNKKKLQTRDILRRKYPRWTMKNMDVEFFSQTLEWHCSTWHNDENSSPDCDAKHLKQIMTTTSDATMKRVQPPCRKRQAHWWNTTLDSLRKECIVARRRWSKYKRKKHRDPAELKAAENNYRLKRKKFSLRRYLKQKKKRG